MIYDNPHDFLHDVVHGKIPLAAVSLEQWLIAQGYAMIDHKLPQMYANLMVGGQLFVMHHCVESIHYPNMVKPIVENKH